MIRSKQRRDKKIADRKIILHTQKNPMAKKSVQTRSGEGHTRLKFGRAGGKEEERRRGAKKARRGCCAL